LEPLRSGVELNDQLLIDGRVHLVARGEADDGLEGLGIQCEPAGDVAHAVLLQAASRDLTGTWGVLDLDLVALLHVVAGDVDLMAVHADMTVVDQLAGGRAALGETEQINNAVEAGLQQLEETFAGDTALILGDFEDAAELALKQAVDVTELLLFIQGRRRTRRVCGGIFGPCCPGGKGGVRRLWWRRKSAGRSADSCGW
jgi:hypothetical protein